MSAREPLVTADGFPSAAHPESLGAGLSTQLDALAAALWPECEYVQIIAGEA